MNFEMPNFALALPEIFVLCMACIVLLVDLFVGERNRFVTYLMAQATLVGAMVLTLGLSSGEVQYTFGGSFVRDTMGDVLKAFIYLAVLLVFVYSRDYLRARQLFNGEYFVLGLFGVLGMMVMVSAHSLLTLYLGLELLSLCLYAMVALQRDSIAATEAAMKYFVLGSLASGILLYGMSMLYGVTGSLDIGEISAYVAQNVGDNLVLKFAIVFVVVGLAFKLGAVPFHMWAPDVYHGAATSVTIYIGTAPKIAAFAMVMRLLVDGLGGLHVEWKGMLVMIAILSLAVGNVIAIAQSNIKRMLAYSTIAHVGFLLLGVLAGTENGYASAMFYIIIYALMGLGGFGMIMLLSRAGFEADRIEDFKGLNERSPWFAFLMMILMISMAGIPVSAGFWAKLAVLQAVVRADMVWLAVVAVTFSVIGAFYYLRIVKLMYFDKPDDTSPITPAFDMRIALSANGLAVLALGVFPGALSVLCVEAMK